MEEKLLFLQAMDKVNVAVPDSAPAISQHSIDIAVALYGIKVPARALQPKLDDDLEDRGLTTRRIGDDKVSVYIGPSAFSSWALLGSTLAHELEVHCNQNFFMIHLMDSLGMDGTGEAERQAYLYEVVNKKRFGLAEAEAQQIRQTMDYYYPLNAKDPKKKLSGLFKTFVAAAASF